MTNFAPHVDFAASREGGREGVRETSREIERERERDVLCCCQLNMCETLCVCVCVKFAVA